MAEQSYASSQIAATLGMAFTLTKLNRATLTEAEMHIKQMEQFVAAAKQGMEPGSDQQLAVETLEWFLFIGKNHYRNLLHCFSVAEKGTHSTEGAY